MLRNVRVLEAENDLSIGNHSFSAQYLKSPTLDRNSVLVAGTGGRVTQADKFTFLKVTANSDKNNQL